MLPLRSADAETTRLRANTSASDSGSGACRETSRWQWPGPGLSLILRERAIGVTSKLGLASAEADGLQALGIARLEGLARGLPTARRLDAGRALVRSRESLTSILRRLCHDPAPQHASSVVAQWFSVAFRRLARLCTCLQLLGAASILPCLHDTTLSLPFPSSCVCWPALRHLVSPASGVLLRRLLGAVSRSAAQPARILNAGHGASSTSARFPRAAGCARSDLL